MLEYFRPVSFGTFEIVRNSFIYEELKARNIFTNIQ